MEMEKPNAREFKIFTEKEFAFVKGKSPNFICYGSVICRAFYEHIKLMEKDDFKNHVLEMISHINSQKKYEIPNILKLYPVKIDDNSELGYLLIDETRGCFPLFFDTHPRVSDSPRLDALKTILEIIRENNQNIFNLLTSGAEWKDIQPAIIELMDHKYNNNQF